MSHAIYSCPPWHTHTCHMHFVDSDFIFWCGAAPLQGQLGGLGRCLSGASPPLAGWTWLGGWVGLSPYHLPAGPELQLGGPSFKLRTRTASGRTRRACLPPALPFCPPLHGAGGRGYRQRHRRLRLNNIALPVPPYLPHTFQASAS